MPTEVLQPPPTSAKATQGSPDISGLPPYVASSSDMPNMGQVVNMKSSDFVEDTSLIFGDVSEQVYNKSRELGREFADEDLASKTGLKKFAGGLGKMLSERLLAKHVREVLAEDATETPVQSKRSAKKQAKIDAIRQRLEERGITGKEVYSQAHQSLVELASAKAAGIEGIAAEVATAESPFVEKFNKEVLVELAVLKAQGINIDKEVVHNQLEKFIKDNSRVPENTEEAVAQQQELQKQINIHFGGKGRKGMEARLVEYLASVSVDIYDNRISTEAIRASITAKMKRLQVKLVRPEVARSAAVTNGDRIARNIGSVFGAEDAVEIASAAVSGVLIGGVARSAARLSGNAVVPVIGGAISGAAVGGAIAGIKGRERLLQTATQVQSEYVSPDYARKPVVVNGHTKLVRSEAVEAKRKEITEVYKKIPVIGKFVSRHPGLVDAMGGFTVVDLQEIVAETAGRENILNISAQQRVTDIRALIQKEVWTDDDTNAAKKLFTDTQYRLRLAQEYREKNVDLLPQEADKEKVQIFSEMIAFKDVLLLHNVSETDIAEAQQEFDRQHDQTFREAVEERVQRIDAFIKGKIIKQVFAGAAIGLAGAGVGYEAHVLAGEAMKFAADAAQAAKHVDINQLGNEILGSLPRTSAHAAALDEAHTHISTLAQQHLEQYGDFEGTSPLTTIQESSRPTVELVNNNGTLYLQQNGIGDGQFPARNWIVQRDPHNSTQFLFYRSDYLKTGSGPITYEGKPITVSEHDLPSLTNGTSSGVDANSALATVARELDGNVSVDNGVKVYLSGMNRVLSLHMPQEIPKSAVHVDPSGNVTIDYNGQQIHAILRWDEHNQTVKLFNTSTHKEVMSIDLSQTQGDHLVPVQVDMFARNLAQTDVPISSDAPLYAGNAHLINNDMALRFDQNTTNQIADELHNRGEQGAWQINLSPKEHIYMKDPEFYKSVVLVNADGSETIITGPQAQELFRTFPHQYVGLAQAQGAGHPITKVDLMTREQTWPTFARVNDVDVSAKSIQVDNKSWAMLRETQAQVTIHNKRITVDLPGGDHVDGSTGTVVNAHGETVGVFDNNGSFHYIDAKGTPQTIPHANDITKAADAQSLNPDQVNKLRDDTGQPLIIDLPILGKINPKGLVLPAAIVGAAGSIYVAGNMIKHRKTRAALRNRAQRTPDQLQATVLQETEKRRFDEAYLLFTNAFNDITIPSENDMRARGLTKSFYSPVLLVTTRLEDLREMGDANHPIEANPQTVIKWPSDMNDLYEDLVFAANNSQGASPDPLNTYQQLVSNINRLQSMLEEDSLKTILESRGVYTEYMEARAAVNQFFADEGTVDEDQYDVNILLKAGQIIQAKIILDSVQTTVAEPATPAKIPTPTPPSGGPPPGGTPAGTPVPLTLPGTPLQGHKDRGVSLPDLDTRDKERIELLERAVVIERSDGSGRVRQSNGEVLLGSGDPRADKIGILQLGGNADRKEIFTALLTQKKLDRNQIVCIIPDNSKIFTKSNFLSELGDLQRKQDLNIVLITPEGNRNSPYRRIKRIKNSKWGLYTSLTPFVQELRAVQSYSVEPATPAKIPTGGFAPGGNPAGAPQSNEVHATVETGGTLEEQMQEFIRLFGILEQKVHSLSPLSYERDLFESVQKRISSGFADRDADILTEMKDSREILLDMAINNIEITTITDVADLYDLLWGHDNHGSLLYKALRADPNSNFSSISDFLTINARHYTQNENVNEVNMRMVVDLVGMGMVIAAHNAIEAYHLSHQAPLWHSGGQGGGAGSRPLPTVTPTPGPQPHIAPTVTPSSEIVTPFNVPDEVDELPLVIKSDHNLVVKPDPITKESFLREIGTEKYQQRPFSTFEDFDPEKRYGEDRRPGIFGHTRTDDNRDVAWISDVGQKRANDEDFLLVRKDGVFVVADGIGGRTRGDIASERAITVFNEKYDVYISKGLVPAEAMRKAVYEANEAVYRDPIGNMGTTFVSAVVHEDKVDVLNVGDSGLYIVGGGIIKKITQDHSRKEIFKRELIANGMDADQAEKYVEFIPANEILGSLGEEVIDYIDVFSDIQVGSDQYILMCCDGLNGLVGNERILAIIDGNGSIEDKVKRLVYEANNNSGNDNISVILISPQTLSTSDIASEKLNGRFA